MLGGGSWTVLSLVLQPVSAKQVAAATTVVEILAESLFDS